MNEIKTYSILDKKSRKIGKIETGALFAQFKFEGIHGKFIVDESPQAIRTKKFLEDRENILPKSIVLIGLTLEFAPRRNFLVEIKPEQIELYDGDRIIWCRDFKEINRDG